MSTETLIQTNTLKERLMLPATKFVEHLLREDIILKEDDIYSLRFPVEQENIAWDSKDAIANDFIHQDAYINNDGCIYNPRSWEYATRLYETSLESKKKFLHLYLMIFEHSTNYDPELIFSYGPDDHCIYYFNPDSNAGGQIVKCPFDDDMARRIIDGEDFIDVVAERTQYLADVNHVSFFDTIEELIDDYKRGKYIGKSETKEDMIHALNNLLQR